MKKNNTTNKPDQFEFGNELDLHHFHPKDTKIVVEEFLRQALENKLEIIRIIHGKGRSIKKLEIYKYLENNGNILSFKDDGYNWGTTVIKLKL